MRINEKIRIIARNKKDNKTGSPQAAKLLPTHQPCEGRKSRIVNSTVSRPFQ